jgi:hypothetical protein
MRARPLLHEALARELDKPETRKLMWAAIEDIEASGNKKLAKEAASLRRRLEDLERRRPVR